MSSSRSAQRGFGLVEILLVLVVVAIAGALLYRYFGATARTVETIQEQRPLATSKLAADQATLDSVQGVLRAYYADRKSTRLNSSHGYISYAVFCLKKKKKGITKSAC